MRRLWILIILLLLVLPCIAGATPARPSQLTFVNDYAGILNAAQSRELTLILDAVEQATGAEIVLVTVPSLEGSDAFTYAQNLFTAWGIGKAGRDNGLLILVSMAEREFRLHTGYGLEGALPDVLLSRLYRDHIVPNFGQERYYEGLMAVIVAGIIPALEKEYNTEIRLSQSQREYGYAAPEFLERYGGMLVILLLLLMLSNRTGRTILWFLLGTSRRGYYGAGRSSGGGRSFGGGRSGGGGAGGRW